MPKTRARNKRAPKSYTQYYNSSEDENDLGIVSGFLEFLMQPKAKTTKRTPNKKRCSTNCPCNKTAPKQKRKHTKDSGNNKGRKKKDEAPTTLNSHINLDSDDEMASTSTTTAYTNSIKNKVDNFFKDIESDDEELESNIKADSVPIKVPIDKNDDFYTILSDSENEEDKKIKEKISRIINAPASTGGLLDAVPTGLNFVNDFKVNPEKKAEDLLAYVDNILKESDETMDLTDSKPKENVPELTLEDMKKKTDEILGDAASLIDNFKPKPKVPELVSTSTTTAYTNSSKNKMNNFFKDLELGEEKLESNIVTDSVPDNVPVDKKNDDFYTILSDSENEKSEKLEEKISSIINVPASTGGISDAVTTGFKVVDDFKVNRSTEGRVENLLAYVDEILKESDETVALTDGKTKENAPVLTLEDMKKKTDEILGDVTSLIDNLKPKPNKEPEKTTLESPAKEAPTCPVCCEQLGGSRQAVATLCGHMFCEPCLKQVVKTLKKCPSCRKSLTQTKYHPVYI